MTAVTSTLQNLMDWAANWTLPVANWTDIFSRVDVFSSVREVSRFFNVFSCSPKTQIFQIANNTSLYLTEKLDGYYAARNATTNVPPVTPAPTAVMDADYGYFYPAVKILNPRRQSEYKKPAVKRPLYRAKPKELAKRSSWSGNLHQSRPSKQLVSVKNYPVCGGLLTASFSSSSVVSPLSAQPKRRRIHSENSCSCNSSRRGASSANLEENKIQNVSNSASPLLTLSLAHPPSVPERQK